MRIHAISPIDLIIPNLLRPIRSLYLPGSHNRHSRILVQDCHNTAERQLNLPMPAAPMQDKPPMSVFPTVSSPSRLLRSRALGHKNEREIKG